MTSREIVERTITFRRPERLAMTLPDPYPRDTFGHGIAPDPDWQPSRTWRPRRGAKWEDEWGNVWARLDKFSKGEVVQGAIEHWSDLRRYRMPRLGKASRYRQAAKGFAAHPDKYRLGSLPGFPFAIMRYLRRMDVFLADLLLHPREVRRLADKVTGLLIRCVDRWAKAGADGVVFCEDWGTQDRLLVSPAMWREIFKPDFQKIVEAARDRGLAVWMHSCGYIYDIIPDLIDVGISVLQLDQPGLFGISRLAREFGGHVTFWCPVDIQRVLPSGNRRRIVRNAKNMVEKLGGFKGGFIAGYYGGNDAIGVKPQWQDWACQAFVRYGTLRRGRRR